MNENEFGATAVKLSQGPLGIIALFIVLIHAFASVLLGFAIGKGENDIDHSILVWFIVLFPVLVFVVFAWIVSTRHHRLYPPGAFKSDEAFVSLMTFGQPTFDDKPNARRADRPEIPKPLNHLRAAAVGNLYWLGHDLMWTADILLRGAPVNEVRKGLAQALHHLRKVGLQDTPLEGQLLSLQAVVKEPVRELPPPLRDQYASQLGSMIDQIGITAEEAQPDWEYDVPGWERRRKKRVKVA